MAKAQRHSIATMLPAIGVPFNCSGSSVLGSTGHRRASQVPARIVAGCRVAAIRCAATLGFSAAAVGCASSGALAAEGAPEAAAETAGTTVTGERASADESLETAATKLLNDARAQPRNCGTISFDAAPPLRWNGALPAAAASHSLWMQSTDSTTHEQDGDSTVGDRAQAAGYRWQAVAENIAAGQSALAEVVMGWLDSPPHCENIMSPEFVDFALAMVRGTERNRFPTWWTLVLARPR